MTCRITSAKQKGCVGDYGDTPAFPVLVILINGIFSPLSWLRAKHIGTRLKLFSSQQCPLRTARSHSRQNLCLQRSSGWCVRFRLRKQTRAHSGLKLSFPLALVPFQCQNFGPFPTERCTPM